MDGGTGKKRITGFAACKELPHRWCRIRGSHNSVLSNVRAQKALYFFGTDTSHKRAIQIVTRALFLDATGMQSPYHANKQKENVRAQLGVAPM